MYLSRPAAWHPEEVLDNEALSRIVDTSSEWIIEHVGIRERRRSPPDMPVHALGARAAALALEGMDPAAVDLVVCALSVSDYHIPSTANLVAAEVGCGGAPAFDIRAACSSFVFALHAVRGLIATGAHRRVLIVVPEMYTHVADYRDRSTCVLWGDGAFACLVSAERPAERAAVVEDTWIGSRSKDALTVRIPVAGTFWQEGSVVQAFAIRKMAEVLTTLLERGKLAPEEVAYVIGHQANLGILTRACARAGFPLEKNLTNIEKYGNCGAAGAPTVLAQEWQRFRSGERIAMATVGSGLSWGGALFRIAADEETP
jgi:3-oxoacyl-[acyl-carrier-protein] synthase-3